MSSFSNVAFAAFQQGIKPIRLDHFYLSDFMNVKQGGSLIQRKLGEIRSELLTRASRESDKNAAMIQVNETRMVTLQLLLLMTLNSSAKFS